MIETIYSFFRNLNKVIKKEDVLLVLDNSISSIQDEVLPALTNIIDNLGHSDVISKNNTIKLLGIGAGMKAKDNRDILIKIKSVLSSISKSDNQISKLVEDELNDIITDKTATVKDIAILRTVYDISFMSTYTLDLLYYLITNPKDSEFPKMKFTDIKNGMDDFTSVLRTYNENLNKRLKDIKGITDTVLDESVNIDFFSKLVAKKGKVVNFGTIGSGFVGNPIYHIRLWLVDNEINKYENLKDKKRLLELKVLELKAKFDGEEPIPELMKQIEYYEDKISSVEYEIRKIEES